MYTPATSTMRYVLPRAELRAQDRRSGAYPTKARTGDRTRTGRNKLYFDDGRTVLFLTGVHVTPPTLLQVSSSYIANDLTSSFVVVGNSFSDALDQWIPHADQVESPGPFNEAYLYEQNEIAIVNSTFMTGAAYDVAPDRFKSNVANKTIVRLEFPLTSKTTLIANSSSLYYLSAASGSFQLIRSEQVGYTNKSYSYVDLMPRHADPVAFTPYGFSYAPINEDGLAIASVFNLDKFESRAPIMNAYVPDGNTLFDNAFYGASANNLVTSFTSSFLNTTHAASSNQVLDMSQYISAPFLLEKAVIEFPIEAGPGWMNDAFQIYPIQQANYDGAGTAFFVHGDMGGPMVTAFLAIQDQVQRRTLIASATFTNARDALTCSYTTVTASAALYPNDVVIQRVGLKDMVNTQVVIQDLGAGSAYSGSNNHFTGTVRLVLEPSVTHHVMRADISGSLFNSSYLGMSVDFWSPTYKGLPLTMGSPSRLPGKTVAGRSVLGHAFVGLTDDLVNGARTKNPVKRYESDYERLDPNDPVHSSMKTYFDVVSKTLKSPFLLYPHDKLILGINKCRPAGTTANVKADSAPFSYEITSTIAQHDIKISTGNVKITLYGDLIRADQEFHDTLNQRLETPELYETVGLEPTLDEFDVFYTSELSGSYRDAFNIVNIAPYVASDLSSSVQLQPYYSHFAGDLLNTVVSTEFAWSRAKKVYEYRSVARNLQVKSDDELFWDCRLVNPQQALTTAPWMSEALGLGGPFVISGENFYENRISSGPYQVLAKTETDYEGTEWFMAYPFEPRFSNVATQFDVDGSDVFLVEDENGNWSYRPFSYNQFVIELGDRPYRKLLVGDFGGTQVIGDNLPKSEFIKVFYGIGDGRGPWDNNHVTGIASGSAGNVTLNEGDPRGTNIHFSAQAGARIRGWKYGMLNGFKTYSKQVYRRDRFGQFRDMLEQRLDTKYYDSRGVKDSPVQVKFYDSKGRPTDPLRTLSSNLSFEATSSVPYIDDTVRNREDYDLTLLNLVNTTISH